MTYHSEASTELNSGTAPQSGKRLGSIPSHTRADHSSKVLRVIQPAGTLLLVEEVEIPHRLVLVRPVGNGDGARNARVGSPGDAFAVYLGVETEGRVFVVQGVVVPAGEEGADAEGRPAR